MVDPDGEISLALNRAFAVFAAGLADGVFLSAENVFGPEIARADAITAAEQARSFLWRQRRQRATEFHCFLRFAQRDANVARQGIVTGHPFIRAFENDDVFLSPQRIDDGGFRER